VEAWVWAGDQVSTGGGSVQSNTTFVAHSLPESTRSFGDHLHIAVVTAKVTLGAALVPGSLFAYDITVSGHGGLKELGLLEDADGPGAGIDAAAPARLALGYLPDRLPTFVTPAPTITDLRIVHSSCRKPHGRGPDALAWLDDVIEEDRLDPVARPQQLFLTGDQIYADDVATCMLPMLTALARELLGFDENVPVRGPQDADPWTLVPAKDLVPQRRARVAIEVARFTSTDSANHLLGFGEFAAMYLAVWSPRVWRSLGTRDTIVAKIDDSTLKDRLHLTDFEARDDGFEGWKADDDKARAEGHSSVENDRDVVVAFSRTVARVARALANCSTYMIFDDHEVTDDWYISGQWRSRVLTSRLGRSVIRNGMMAYSIMQAPGNDPAKWATPAVGPGVPVATPEVELHEKIIALVGDRESPTTAHENDVDAKLGLTSPTAVPAVSFHYSVEGPRHRVNVLDTRTRRTYDSVMRHSPPRLVGDALDSMLPAGPLSDGRELEVVVSPVPVLFPRLFDVLAQPALSTIFDLKTHIDHTERFDPARPSPALVGSEAYDVEGWGAHEEAFTTFIRRLATYARVVILSGDVHFASSMVCDVWTKGDDSCDSRILQCTSSAAKNEWGTRERAVIRGQRSAQKLLQGTPFERLGWDGEHGVVLQQGAAIRPGRRARLLRSPTVVPAGGWPAGTTLKADRPPDVRFRIAVLRDERPAAMRGVGVPTPPALPDWNASDPRSVYATVAARHQSLASSNMETVRLMVFASNIGIVTFSDAGGGEHVATHAVMSPAGDGTTGEAYTEHSVALSRSGVPAPPILRTVV